MKLDGAQFSGRKFDYKTSFFFVSTVGWVFGYL